MSYADRYTKKPATDIFTSDTDIDRRQCTRTVPMRALLLAPGRTGTASMRAAMKQLGFVDTYHMMNCSIENPPDALLWMDALRAKYDGVGEFTRKDWDKLLGGSQAVCDWPACAFAKELIEAYPEAKVVMTTRDVDSWHASTMKTLGGQDVLPNAQEIFRHLFEGDFPNRGKDVFTRHYADVKKMVPPERLLEYRVQDGWEPLCKFLDVPVPRDMPFPNVNDNSDFITRSRRRNRAQMYNVAAEVLEVLGLVLVLFLIFYIQNSVFS
ncbi:hypothetical protein CIB48_g6835 [Xylaria polymorpha]|nr:hypothetical protein CIB48_g6835 [Xylaria polymorpha]